MATFALILACILFSIVEFELRGNRTLHKALDVFFLVVFSAEAVLKMIGYGVWWEPDEYFGSGWNSFDFLVAVWMLIASNVDGGETLKCTRCGF